MCGGGCSATDKVFEPLDRAALDQLMASTQKLRVIDAKEVETTGLTGVCPYVDKILAQIIGMIFVRVLSV